MKLEIITPTKVIREDSVDHVALEGPDGWFGILNDHMPMLADIGIAPLYYEKGDEQEYVAVMGGAIRVLGNTVTVISEEAERAMDIDALVAKKEKETAEAYLTKKTEITDMIKAEVQLRKALLKLKVVEVSKRI